MKRLLTVLFLFITSLAFAETPYVYRFPTKTPVKVYDTVSADAEFLKLDLSNDPVTGELDQYKAADDLSNTITTYGALDADYPRIQFQHSQTDTALAMVETDNNSYLGYLGFYGVSTGLDFVYGSRIYSRQIGASGAASINADLWLNSYNIKNMLFDNAGVCKWSVIDSDSAEVASVDSNGNLTAIANISGDIGIFASGVTASAPTSAVDLALYSWDGAAASVSLTLSGSADTATFTDTAGNTLTWSTGSLVDDSGAISFGSNDLTTTGTLGAGATTVTGLIITRSETELVTNGTFATDISGWTTGAGGGSSVTWSATNGGCMYISGHAANAWADQSFTTVVGQTYILRVDLKSNSEANATMYISAGIVQGGTTLLNSLVSGVATYTKTFTATTTTTWIRFYSGWNTYIDNASVYPLSNYITEENASQLTVDNVGDITTSGFITTTNDIAGMNIVATTRMALPTGSLSSLSCNFTGETGTGFYKSAAGVMKFLSQGSEMMTIGGGANSYMNICGDEFYMSRNGAGDISLRVYNSGGSSNREEMIWLGNVEGSSYLLFSTNNTNRIKLMDDGELQLLADYVSGAAGCLTFGAGQDANMGYDGTNLNINPQAVGTGSVNILGTINATKYQGQSYDLIKNFGGVLASGTENIFIGQSGNATLTGASNYAYGYLAGYNLTTGSNNYFLGSEAGRYDTTGAGNTFIGSRAGRGTVGNSTPTGNVAIGADTLMALTDGTYNMALGYQAGLACTTGDGNVLIGQNAGLAIVGGQYNVAIGAQQFQANASGVYNVSIGTFALNANTAHYNVAVGGAALYTCVGTSNSVGLGYAAGKYETAGSKLFIDAIDRTSEALGRTNSLIYGVFNAAPLSQSITFNVGTASFGAGNVSTTGILSAKYLNSTDGYYGTTLSSYALVGQNAYYDGGWVIPNIAKSNTILLNDTQGLQYWQTQTAGAADWALRVQCTMDGNWNFQSGSVTIGGILQMNNAIYFTQTDGNEYIDSLNDGYLDLGATTAIRLNDDTNLTGNFFLSDNYSVQFRGANQYVNSDNANYLDLHATTAIRNNSDVIMTEQTGNTIQTTTLGAAATTFAVTKNVVVLTGDALANILATITGGLAGQTITIIFTDALITITDDATGGAGTINLSAAFVSTANDTLTLVSNGTSWRETARSIN